MVWERNGDPVFLVKRRQKIFKNPWYFVNVISKQLFWLIFSTLFSIQRPSTKKPLRINKIKSCKKHSNKKLTKTTSKNPNLLESSTKSSNINCKGTLFAARISDLKAFLNHTLSPGRPGDAS